ncbi:uncharacterized protein PAN0_037d6309 [Moesziomyces antarcticus]|uniref:Uncharacterized protein n=1 Tax=Pseudozyma antarctica TaxID=84753 RepID=A0A081CN30_PSEA2|nr:uncharacterized protein PAN0_037d6309 [Moesziomyces antarcticus]GAK68076.1 hypothetical protein PAN0_037d6309 [Moesziomyces antarcticus]
MAGTSQTWGVQGATLLLGIETAAWGQQCEDGGGQQRSASNHNSGGTAQPCLPLPNSSTFLHHGRRYKVSSKCDSLPLLPIFTACSTSIMQFTRLTLFVLAVVAGQVASKSINRPDDPTQFLKTDDNMVGAYCEHKGTVPAGDYACFRLNGDIRQRMQSADDSTKGFVNTAGNMFVVLLDPATKVIEFHTDRTGVWISHPDGNPCVVVTTLNDADWNGNQDGGDDGSVDHNACTTDPAIWLAD